MYMFKPSQIMLIEMRVTEFHQDIVFLNRGHLFEWILMEGDYAWEGFTIPKYSNLNRYFRSLYDKS